MPAQPLRGASCLLELTYLSEVQMALCLFVCEVLADSPKKNKVSTQLPTENRDCEFANTIFVNTISSRTFEMLLKERTRNREWGIGNGEWKNEDRKLKMEGEK